jgi:hypothetical protein
MLNIPGNINKNVNLAFKIDAVRIKGWRQNLGELDNCSIETECCPRVVATGLWARKPWNCA